MLPQENLDVSKGDLLGRRGIGLGGSGGGAEDERMAFPPFGSVVGLIASRGVILPLEVSKGWERSSRQLGAKIEKFAGMEGSTQRSQTKAVFRGVVGEGKSLGVNSAIERVGEV